MKLSEIAEKLGVTPDQLVAELEIEGAGKFQDLTARAAKATELEATLESKQQELASYAHYLQGIQTQAQQAVQQTGQVPDWYNDELLRPIAQSFQALQAEVRDLQEKKLGVVANTLQNFISQAVNWANAQEVRHLKREYPDFDESRVKKYAQERSINDWETAYQAERSSRLPDLIKAEMDKARKEGLQEGMSHMPVEMGSVNPAPLPELKKNYQDAWTQFAQELQTGGFGN